MYAFKCTVCGKTFISKYPNRKACSETCGKAICGQLKSKCIECGKTIYRKTTTIKTNLTCIRCKLKKEEDEFIRNHFLPNPTPKETESDVNIGLLRNNIAHTPNTWNIPGFNQSIKIAVKNRDGWRCFVCRRETNLHVHHIVPRSKGGKHEMDNLVTLCSGCHRSIENGDVELAIKSCVRRALANV